jgi:hypothetical protein
VNVIPLVEEFTRHCGCIAVVVVVVVVVVVISIVVYKAAWATLNKLPYTGPKVKATYPTLPSRVLIVGFTKSGDETQVEVCERCSSVIHALRL